MVGRALTKVYWRTSTYLSAEHAGHSKSEDAEKLRPKPYGYGMFWGSGGIGIPSVPEFWKVFHAGDVTVHHTKIESFSHQDVVNLQNGHSVATDMVILCTGFDKGYKAFTKELQEECGLYYDNTEYSRLTKLDARGEQKVDELLPFLRNPPVSSTQARVQPAHGPKQGKKHAYFIYDYLSYIDTLTRDLGLNVSREGNQFAEMFAPYRPVDYCGLIDEYFASRAKRKLLA
ncbi:hypothetical protein OEA41_005128 [Lepraria neglecta]|uniref:Flavin-containing monooxygenase n=1 Tax=Lepraria neglecta TaxID=209136 RepID=A0AAD9YZ70_9LECA|nr:hypothetical protein OEA41_005128 [Lepraria neglecta]